MAQRQNMNRILVIRGGALGDFILTLPVLKLLRNAFPSARIEILGYKHIIALAELSGYANATRSIEYARLSSFFSRNAELARELVDYFSSFDQIISYLFDPDEIFAANLKRSGVRNLIAGSPKISGAEHAARQLARPLERISTLRSLLPNERISVAQNLPLPQLAMRLGSCAFFIGHDSGISHLAAAIGTRSLLLFGPTDSAIWAPANVQVRVLRSEDRMMSGIAVAQVLDALREVLGGT